MSMNLEHFIPAARPWVENLVNVWPTPYVKPNFAFWEVGHVLSLIALGGATILMNLRLIGVGLTQEPPSEIYRNLRTVQTLGVIGIVVTGVLIGMANAERLYDSAAFIVKMLALIGGLVLTYGVSRTTAAAEGRVSTTAKIWFVVGMAFWLLALLVFLTGGLIAPGIWHVVTAAALLVLFVTKGRARIRYVGVLAVLVLAQELASLMYHHGGPSDVDAIDVSFAVIIPAWIVGTALVQFFRAGQGEEGGPLTKIIGCVTILVWLTSAAAGRWIAFA